MYVYVCMYVCCPFDGFYEKEIKLAFATVSFNVPRDYLLLQPFLDSTLTDEARPGPSPQP